MTRPINLNRYKINLIWYIFDRLSKLVYMPVNVLDVCIFAGCLYFARFYKNRENNVVFWPSFVVLLIVCFQVSLSNIVLVHPMLSVCVAFLFLAPVK